MATEQGVLFKSKSMPNIKGCDKNGADFRRRENNSTSILKNLPTGLNGIKATLTDGHFDLRRLQKWITNIPIQVVKENRKCWEQIAEIVNVTDGYLATQMLEKLRFSMKKAVSAQLQDIHNNREKPEERSSVHTECSDGGKPSVADEALLETGHTMEEIKMAKEELIRRKENPSAVSAVRLSDIIDSMRTTAGKSTELTDTATDDAEYASQFESKDGTALCGYCATILRGCADGCGKIVVARDRAAGRQT